MSGGEGKGYTGNVKAFWDGLEKGDFHMLIYDLVSFCDEEYKKSDCFPCTAKTICEGNCGEHCKECLDDKDALQIMVEEMYPELPERKTKKKKE